MDDMKVTALLPMKGHSQRVADKNIRPFVDEPLLCKVLGALDCTEAVERVIVNTDSETIAEIAAQKSPKVLVHVRPEELRGDYVSMNLILEYDIEHCDGEVFLQTHSTNPLLKSETISAAIMQYAGALRSGSDSLFSVTRYQTRLYDRDGAAVNHDPRELIRTQDLPPLFEENSCLYIFSRESFRGNAGRRIGRNPFMFEIGKTEAIDIDTEEDFRIAEAVYRLR